MTTQKNSLKESTSTQLKWLLDNPTAVAIKFEVDIDMYLDIIIPAVHKEILDKTIEVIMVPDHDSGDNDTKKPSFQHVSKFIKKHHKTSISLQSKSKY